MTLVGPEITKVRALIEEAASPLRCRLASVEHLLLVLVERHKWKDWAKDREPRDDELLEAVEAIQAIRWCSQCGQTLEKWACGPTHAARRALAGMEWDGVTPGSSAPQEERRRG